MLQQKKLDLYNTTDTSAHVIITLLLRAFRTGNKIYMTQAQYNLLKCAYGRDRY